MGNLFLMFLLHSAFTCLKFSGYTCISPECCIRDASRCDSGSDPLFFGDELP